LSCEYHKTEVAVELGAYEFGFSIRTCFSQRLAQSRSRIQNPSEPKNRLDEGIFSAHLAISGKETLMSDLVAYVDGGSLGNPGPSGIGVIIDGCESGPIRIAKWIGHQDNNVAEYMALMEALQCALSLKAKALHVYSDSQVVVRQMRGEYSCRSSRLYSLHWTCRKLARALAFSISHVPRENNTEANSLANTAVRQRIV
jgi:ribonuclease HI